MDIKECILNVITKIDQIPISEDDLKFKLAWGLKELNPSKKISIEYPIKKILLGGNNNIGNNKLLYFDLMIGSENNFIPIEIKYKTKYLELTRNILGSKDDLELKNQSAQNLAKYGFWKDVYRIQSLKNNFSSIRKGYQIFLTNEGKYKNQSKINSQVKNFEINDNRFVKENTELFWLYDGKRVDKVDELHFKNKTFYKMPGFKIDSNYLLKWQTIKLENKDFYLLILEV